jgi:imidazolonepropionase-like amidohydrolase
MREAKALHARGRIVPGDTIRDVFIVDGRFTFTPQDDATTIFDGGYLLPGLVDAHAHLGLASPAPRNATARQRSEASARAHLNAGVLVIREPGGPDRSSTGIGPGQGLPRVQTAGHFLAPFGGYFGGLAREIRMEDLPAEATAEARASGAWAKAIGDFPNDEGEIAPNFSLAVLTEAVKAVHAIGARFAIHCVGEAAIEMAIEAGVDTLEHAVMARPEHVAAMARRGVTWTPTLDIAPHIPGAIEGSIHEREMARLEQGLRDQPSRVRDAHAAGVRILAGTDAAMVPHGTVREEMALLLDAGLPADAVLAAGSYGARAYLGHPGIEEGAPADLVAFSDDPRDPSELAHPAVIVLDGHQIRKR